MLKDNDEMLSLDAVTKTFVMHLRGSARLSVVTGVSLSVSHGECVVLGGPSGTGKSSILKMIYGNYRTDGGRIEINGPAGRVDVARASPRAVMELRKSTVGYVSQFLRVIPRIGALDIVAAAGRDAGLEEAAAEIKASALLNLLNVPERLWHLPPATFSGGEQQRINLARGFAAERPVLLLDEPTASLDAANRAGVVELIEARKRAGTAILGIFHDEDVRERVADRVIDVTQFVPGA